jgi:hypothetical protein
MTVQSVVPGAAILRVVSMQVTSTGFVIDFTRAAEVSVLNLIDTQTGGLGPSDVTLVGATVGPVAGSLVLDATGKQFTFIKTGGPLAPDTYTLTIRSSANGIRAADGTLLDGNQTGGGGDPFITAFTIAPTGAPTLSLPDFVRGPGQPVNVPAAGGGLPLRISNGQGVEGVDVTFTYDPALLTITGVLPSSSLPAGSLVQANLTVPGIVRITIALPTPLNSGPQDLVIIQATVPATAPYRAKQILHFTQAIVNELPALSDDAIELVAYIGDTTGTGTYSSLDAQRILRFAAGLDSGFILFPLLDPVLLADTTANGSISSLDATRMLQEIVGLDRPEIPSLPGIIIPTPVADPLVSMPADRTGTAGSIVTVPVNIDDANLLESVDLRIAYDSSVLEVNAGGIRLGALTEGANLFTNVDQQTGTIYVSLFTPQALRKGPGVLLEIDFQIRKDAPGGETLVDIQKLHLNEGALVLTIDPATGRDEIDGRITVMPKVVPATQRTANDLPHTSVVFADRSERFQSPVELSTDLDFPELPASLRRIRPRSLRR